MTEQFNKNYFLYNQYGNNLMETEGPIGLIAMPGSRHLVDQINQHLYQRRLEYLEANAAWLSTHPGFIRDTYVIETNCIRFSSGEGKATLGNTVRGHDIYIVTDVLNHAVYYRQFDEEVPMGPDDHFQDLIRIILACNGKAKRINVLMPLMYESHHSVRKTRESLDCAYMLKELDALGVDSIITFDPHDAGIENALPRRSIDDLPVTYQMIKTLFKVVPELKYEGVDNCAMAVSSDETGMKRAIFYSSILGIPLGTFYRQRDFSQVIKGKNPTIDYHFLGESPEGRDILIIDDMLLSGRTFIETARKLKAMKAKRIFALITFGIFVEGIEALNQAFHEGIFDRIFCTNANYHDPELELAPWFVNVDITRFTALVIDALNHNASISSLIDQRTKIGNFLSQHKQRQRFDALAYGDDFGE